MMFMKIAKTGIDFLEGALLSRPVMEALENDSSSVSPFGQQLACFVMQAALADEGPKPSNVSGCGMQASSLTTVRRVRKFRGEWFVLFSRAAGMIYKRKLLMAKKSESEAIANQLSFAVKELSTVAERLRIAGYDELGAEIQTLANSGQFFAEEFARVRSSQLAE